MGDNTNLEESREMMGLGRLLFSDLNEFELEPIKMVYTHGLVHHHGQSRFWKYMKAKILNIFIAQSRKYKRALNTMSGIQIVVCLMSRNV